MKKNIYFLLVILIALNTISASSNIIEKNGVKYFADRIVVKFKDAGNINSLNKSQLSLSTQKVFESFGLSKIQKRFSTSQNISHEEIELSKIAVIENQSPNDPLFISRKLSNLPEIEWAEPHYIDELAFDPNDLNDNVQYSLPLIQAPEAWDITKGDPDIIIAIIDTGVYWDHPDLLANIWQNLGEDADGDGRTIEFDQSQNRWILDPNDLNGIDDDDFDNDPNTFIDDLIGWDFGGLDGTPDNNPAEDRPDHGTHVAGIASAVTDNGIGVASIGFNSKIMAVKTSRDDVRDHGVALISNGYDGIIYAADNGAHVINCSWGGSGFSRANQEVINYAVSKGALVVAAAGNDGHARIDYPSRYKGVLSVGSTNSGDFRSSFSNYGIQVDVMAPGSGIESTWENNDYDNWNGTSMASPLVAGLAGLVFSKFDYLPLQVAEQIRINADNIDAKNPGDKNLLGSGRINAFKAVSNTKSKSLRADEYTFIDDGDGDGFFEPGEEVLIEINFTNYLSSLSSLSITVETASSSITMLNNTFNKGAVASGETFNNSSNKFRFAIGENVTENLEAEFLLRYSDGNYNDFQWATILVNPTYRTHDNDKISLTITSKGTLGFNNYYENTQGDGFQYNQGQSILFEGALMYGVSVNLLNDAARDESGDSQRDEFENLITFDINKPGLLADQQGFTMFNDDNASSNKLGVETELSSFVFNDSPNDEFIILEYLLKNKSSVNYNNFYVGLYFDWDIGANDITRNSSTDKLAYQFSQGSDLPYVGVSLLSTGSMGYYAIRNDGNDSGFGIYDGFTKAEKWQALSNGISKAEAGAGDVSYVISAGPFSLASNNSVEFAVAIAAGDDFDSMINNVERSKEKYGLIITSTDDEEFTEEIPSEYKLNQNYPNPFNPNTVINYQLKKDGFTTLKVFDILGNEIVVLVDEYQTAGNYDIDFRTGTTKEFSLPSGIYLYTLRSGDFVSTKKMVLLK